MIYSKIHFFKYFLIISLPLVYLVNFFIAKFDQQEFTGIALFIIIIWMIVWWIADVLPRAITSLIPLIIFPSIGIFQFDQVASFYSNSYTYLFTGGFLIAIALEKYDVHKFIAVKMIKLIGFSAKRIVFSILLVTFLISMFVTNTATTMMMLPFVMSLADNISSDNQRRKNFIISLLLAVAFGATLGGLSNLYGTPPNLILASFIKTNFGYELYSLGWLQFGLPIGLTLLIVAYFAITKIFSAEIESHDLKNIFEFFHNKKLSLSGIITLIIFSSTCLLWVFKPLINGFFDIILTEEWIALSCGLILFVIPKNLEKDRFILNLNDCRKLPWDILLIFGAGVAISNAMQKCHFYDVLAEYFTFFRNGNEFHIACMLIIVCLILTEFISNTALSLAIIPIVMALALALNLNPVVLGIVATMAINSSFILFIATPPNTMIMINNIITGRDLAKVGIFIKLAALIVFVASYYFGLFDSYHVNIQLVEEGEISL
ncbi:SLC13 family permease [Rickettsiales endosymbiont of Stachyamoeba lipophora]|uniref:SLC13 family permease n=1 Tax=Rickettsiales endosymbiont of Stachyamoeba lipophora TaxID=2486578 RepID=UPI0013DDE6E7|nr:DASS family sodium-coupled anion symporter [Rickettsiales endosymbiont of Stachyamoeba lipophora]